MCLGNAVDKLPGATSQPLRNSSAGAFIPTLGESLDPHYMRTNSNAEARHEKVGVHKYDAGDAPEPPKMPTPPQAVKAPTPAYLTRRNKDGGGMGGAGSTLLTSPSGLGAPILGKTTLLGGG